MVPPERPGPDNGNPRLRSLRHYFSAGVSTASRQREYSSSRLVTWSSLFAAEGATNPVEPLDFDPTFACEATNFNKSKAISSVRRDALLLGLSIFQCYNPPLATHKDPSDAPIRMKEDGVPPVRIMKLNNWIEVSEPNLVANYATVRATAGEGTEVLAVVKAGAYGHGLTRCSQALARAGARWLGVTSVAEGVAVRAAAGPDVDVLVMCGFLPEDATAIREHGLVPVVWTKEQVRWLGAGRVHVEVDTGIARQGVTPGNALVRLLDVLADAGMELDGLLTHFSSSEEAHSQVTERQQQRFEAAIAQVKAAGVRPRWIHAGNTSTLDNPAQNWPWLEQLAHTVGARAMVRVGLALYGYCLPIHGVAEAQVQPVLKLVMTWKAKVLAARTLEVGETVGYGATFVAQRPMRIATLGVGYADGLRRELSHGGWLMVRGKRAAILGRISMNLTVVDVTEIEEVCADEVAVVLGEGITADDHARLAGTIAYEILCTVGARFPNVPSL